jgi:hypothetical protein
MRPALIVALAALIATGCLHPMRGDPPPGLGDDAPMLAKDSSLIAITVENRGFDNMTVYVDGESGFSQRLGTVNGFGEGVFRLGDRWPEGTPYRLRATVLRNQSNVTPPSISALIVARPGQQVTWTVYWDQRNNALDIY